MRLTEFRERLEAAVGPAQVGVWASMQVLPQLGNRTVEEAIADGVGAKQVWAAVHDYLGLPASER